MDIRPYDSKGIIPRVDEEEEAYGRRARHDLDSLQRFCHDVRERKLGQISAGNNGVDAFLRGGEYTVFDNPPMWGYGLSEVPIPVVGITSDTYKALRQSNNSAESYANNTSVEYKGRKLPMTFVDIDAVESEISERKKIRTHSKNMRPMIKLFEEMLKYAIEENMRALIIGHEAIHGIRTLAGLQDVHFDELVALANHPQISRLWNRYFSGIGIEIYTSQDQLRKKRLLDEYEYLKEKVGSGLAERFPLPLLLRISFREFVGITDQMENGKDMKAVVNERARTKSTYSWRWRFIAELCEF